MVLGVVLLTWLPHVGGTHLSFFLSLIFLSFLPSLSYFSLRRVATPPPPLLPRPVACAARARRPTRAGGAATAECGLPRRLCGGGGGLTPPTPAFLLLEEDVAAARGHGAELERAGSGGHGPCSLRPCDAARGRPPVAALTERRGSASSSPASLPPAALGAPARGSAERGGLARGGEARVRRNGLRAAAKPEHGVEAGVRHRDNNVGARGRRILGENVVERGAAVAGVCAVEPARCSGGGGRARAVLFLRPRAGSARASAACASHSPLLSIGRRELGRHAELPWRGGGAGRGARA